MMYRLKKEIARSLHSKQTWFFIFLLSIVPVFVTTNLFGLIPRLFYSGQSALSFSESIIFNPAKLSLYISSAIMILYTLFVLQKIYGTSAYILIESKTNPATYLLRQVICVLLVAGISTLLSLAVLYPYTMVSMSGLFQFSQFIRIWLYLYFGGLCIVAILAAGIYMLICNVEVTFVLLVFAMIIGVPKQDLLDGFRSDTFLLPWLETAVSSFTDGYPGEANFSVILYTRLFWFVVSIGILTLGLLGVRRYGKNAVASMVQNAKKIALPVLLILCCVGTYLLSAFQPFFQKNVGRLPSEYYYDENAQLLSANDEEWNEEYEEKHVSNINLDVMITTSSLEVKMHKEKPYVSGKTTHTLSCIVTETNPIYFQLPVGISITKVLINGEEVEFEELDYVDEYLGSYVQIAVAPPFSELQLETYFEGRPLLSQRNNAFPAPIASDYTNMFVYPHLLVSGFELRQNKEEYFHVSIDADKEFFTPGCIIDEVESTEDGYHTYIARMVESDKVMSAPIIIGDFVTERFRVGDTDVEFIYFKNKEKLYKEIGASAYLKKILSYYQEKLGAPALYEGKPLVIIENGTGTTASFAEGSACYINENALVQLHFSNYADAKHSEQTLAEMLAGAWWGIATSTGVYWLGYGPLDMDTMPYCTSLLYMRDMYGKDYVQQIYLEPGLKKAESLKNAFYPQNKQLAPLLTLSDAFTLYYLPQTEINKGYAPWMFFEMETLTGGGEAFTDKLHTFFEENKGKASHYASQLSLLEMLGINYRDLETLTLWEAPIVE